VSYTQLIDKNANISEVIGKGFGENGIGLIAVSDVPNYTQLRNDLLPLGYEFARLPDHVKAKYEHPQSHYSFGWSHAKEQLKKGVPDIYKGSYYNNPQYEVPTTDPEQIAKTPEVSCANIWPTEDLPALEPAFKNLGQLMIQVGLLLAHHCDKYILSKLGDKFRPENYLEDLIKKSTAAKARLLHYFEVTDKLMDLKDIDSWCGWHNDHDSLTALTSAMYRDLRTGDIISCPDPEAGLYARERSGRVVKIKIPISCIAFQIGECSQILSGGHFRATPHAVKGPNPPHSSYLVRDSFALFMQPNPDHLLTIPQGTPLSSISVGQFKEGMNFGAFGKATIEFYYS
jgi:isopenicillin N synthase-like dioxygenase